jgi:ABC-type dipeptide/oligopeptide/nickel transport system permease subunit
MTWPESVRDMVIASMERGLLLPMLLFLLVIAVIIKMPAEAVSAFVADFFEKMAAGEMIFSVLFILSVGGWYSQARVMKKQFEREYERIGREKSELQEKLMKRKLHSSEAL